MARGRILSKSISHSVKIARLYELNPKLGEFASLLFSWIIPHTDDQGQISADPMSLKFEVLSNSPRKIPEIQEAVHMLYKVKLIKLGRDEDTEILQINNFDGFQSFRSDRKRQNKFPNVHWYTNDIPMTYQWVTLSSQEKLSEVKLSEANKRILLNDNYKFENISKEQIKEWEEAYPALKIKNEILKAATWIKANPKNAKKNYERFLVNWFIRGQDRALNKTKENTDDYDTNPLINSADE